MLFNSLEFWIFLPLVLLFSRLLPRRPRNLFLLFSSYLFYMWWDARFILLIVASTLVDFLVGRSLPSARGQARSWLLIASLAANLGLLGFFKYYNFLAGSLAGLLGLPPRTLYLDIILPVGISFYTFQSMSYTIDIYRGRLEPVKGLTDFALYVAFFPQLVAGPIVRAREFFPQLFQWRPPSQERTEKGISLILIGLVKKMVLADHFARISDLYFGDVAAHPGAWEAWSASFAFAMQIFFDFSGYTDIARGCGRLLGYEFPVNFRRPYLARSITEFWRRWHISLSSWLRDYLYIPLGENRKGRQRTYENLMVTMLLGGLWHGASWNFVFWGGLHGLLLAIERLARDHFPGLAVPPPIRLALVPLRTAATFVLVMVGWVFFRASSFQDSFAVLNSMFLWDSVGSVLLPSGLILATVLTLVVALAEESRGLLANLHLAPVWARVSTYAFLLIVLELFAVTGEEIPFVYFQF